METSQICRLSDDELERVMVRANVSPLGKALVRSIRHGDPVSAPKADRKTGNTTGWYPSLLMHAALQLGSAVPDLLMFIELDGPERHPHLLEYWNRPVQIPNVIVRDRVGRHITTTTYRPRILCIEENAVFFRDFYTREALENCASERPTSFRKDADGTWSSPEIQDALIPFGIGRRIWVDEQFGPYYLGNISYLRSEFLNSREPPDDENIKAIVRRVERDLVVYRRELVADGISADDVKWCIAHRLVYFPLTEEDLSSIEMARLYVDRDAYLNLLEQRRADGAGPPTLITTVLPKLGQTIGWHGVEWKVVNSGDKITMQHADGPLQEFSLTDAYAMCESGGWTYEAIPELTFNTVSPKRKFEAAEKLGWASLPSSQCIWTYGAKKGQPVSEPTLRRIRAAVKKAESEHSSPLLALVNGYDNCGDTSHRNGQSEWEVWRASLSEDYLCGRRPRFASAVATYRIKCKEKGIKPVSTTTCKRRLLKEQAEVIVQTRFGEFVAYERGQYVPRDKGNSLIKGRIPWEVAHVDHAKIEVTVQSAITGQPMKREVWRTVLRDAKTFRVLGLVVFFGAPSYESLYRLIVDVVRRWGRLPQYIVSDRGWDFMALQWELMLADCGTTKLNRPSKKPRAGNVAESGNKKDDESITENLDGNRLRLPDFRKIAPGFRPEDMSVHTLSSLRQIYEEAYFDIEPKHPTSRTNGEILDAYEKRLLKQFGETHIPKVKYDNNFRIKAMPRLPNRHGIRTVTSRGSVEGHNFEYFARELKLPGIMGTDVEVHYDTDNAGHVFAWVDQMHRWLECTSDEYETLRHFTVGEIDEYTAMLKQAGEISKVEKRYNKAEAYAELLRCSKKSKPLIHLHEMHHGNATGFEGFTIVDGVVEIDLNDNQPAGHLAINVEDSEVANVPRF
ncbi:Mu transposase C-terminal domain-containing protein [Paraburkholderia nemoris]|uniref:Mu transposase C-terminal domain-containing protein n=1 Tax=Paraburkholderia nemoris TaxID=2793076 RepID=UPI0038BB1E9C